MGTGLFRVACRERKDGEESDWSEDIPSISLSRAGSDHMTNWPVASGWVGGLVEGEDGDERDGFQMCAMPVVIRPVRG
jgi:hypothetical protein